jgi:hypothetical protein
LGPEYVIEHDWPRCGGIPEIDAPTQLVPDTVNEAWQGSDAARSAASGLDTKPVAVRIAPDDWRELRARLRLPAKGAIAAAQRPRILNEWGESESVMALLGSQEVPLDDNGEASVTIPGSMSVLWPWPQPTVQGPAFYRQRATTEVRNDGSRVLHLIEPPPELAGTLRLDGQPAAGASVLLSVPQVRDGKANGLIDRWRAPVDDQGAFRFVAPAGAWTLVAELPRRAGGVDRMPLLASQPLAVGQRVERAFAFATAPLRVVLQHADGRALADAKVLVRRVGNSEYGSWTTGPDGAFDVEHVEQGRYELWTWRDDLQDGRARRKWFDAHPGVAEEIALVWVGEVVVPQREPAVLRLPK